MKARSLLAAAAVAVASAVALGASASASATTMSQHGSTPGTHAAEIRGFRPALGIRVPASRLPHLTPKATNLSTNWSGYTALANKNVAVRFVGADWNVPSINPAECVPGTSGFAYAIHWVGLDGFGSTPNGSSTTVEQIGTGADCQSGGTISYYTFYEMSPAPPVVFTGVSPGDAITSSVYFNSASNQYNLVLTDVTTGSQINVDQSCPAGVQPDGTTGRCHACSSSPATMDSTAARWAARKASKAWSAASSL